MKKHRLRTFAATAALLAGLASFGLVSSTLAADPVSLDGEQLIKGRDGADPVGPNEPNGIPTTDFVCDRDGTSSFSFAVSGTAVGPYPGTYTETGTVTFGPHNINGGLAAEITSFQAQFTITSPNGTVTGTKAFVPNTGTGVAVCNIAVGQGGAGVNTGYSVNYTANISTPAGEAIDRGVAYQSFNACRYIEACGTGSGNYYSLLFESQNFTVLPPPPAPPAPTSADQCNKGGWKNYPTLGFKNQGDCVSYVSTHGKNEPGKNVPN